MTSAKKKMHVVLAKTEHLQKIFSAAVTDYVNFFKNKGTAFKGERKTYTAENGTIDQPGQRSNKLVITTVQEKLDWFLETNSEYIDLLFALERTNASNVAKAPLIVDGIDFGVLSSLELLRLKNILENDNLKNMYSEIPVRTEDEIWKKSTDPQYAKREVFEGILMSGEQKSTVKESFILPDPNVSPESPAYKPTVGSKDTIIKLGEYTYQKYSGEWNHRERAEVLRRRSVLLAAVIEALKVANDVETIDSDMTAKKLFGYLHTGKIS